MDTSKALALADLVEQLNGFTFKTADEAKDKVLARTGNKQLAQTEWMRVATMGLNVTTDIVEKLSDMENEHGEQ